MSTPRRNWREIRASYVEGLATDPDGDPSQRSWPTLQEVADLHGVSVSHMKHRAAKEKWTEARDEYQAELDALRRRTLLQERADRSVRVDDRALTASEAALSLVGIRLTRLVNLQRNMTADQRGGGIDARELAQLGLATKRFVDVKAHVMGQPSTTPEAELDEMERRQRIEERNLAESMAAFIAERAAEAAADVDAAAAVPAPPSSNGHGSNGHGHG